MIWLNCLKLNITSIDSVVKVGDTYQDVLEARNAGCWALAVVKSSNEIGMSFNELQTLEKTNPEKYKQLLSNVSKKFYETGAHYICNDIKDLPLIIQKINTRLSKGEKP